MIKYKEISNKDYYNLRDKSGYYCIKYPNGLIVYYKNYKYHREDGTSLIYTYRHGDYYLNGKYYGNENDYTDESWTRFCKLQAFI